MPIYDYFCKKCDELKELYHSRPDDEPEECLDCGEMCEKVFTTDGINLKSVNFVPPPLARRKFGDDRPTAHQRKKWT